MNGEHRAELFLQAGRKKGKKHTPPVLKLRFVGDDPPRDDEPAVSKSSLTEGAKEVADGLKVSTDPIDVLVEISEKQISRIRLPHEPTETPSRQQAEDTRKEVAQAEFAASTNTVTTPKDVTPRGKPGVFRNPYNFVPYADRAVAAPPFGDDRPVGHDRYVADRFSGRLVVQAEVVTPLLLPGRSDNRDHPTFDIRQRPAEKPGDPPVPYIAPTGIRGVLRARYEALTNSRFGVISEALSRPTAFRLTTDDAQRAMPTVVYAPEGVGHPSAKIVPLPGTSRLTAPTTQERLWSAWIPRRLLPDWAVHGAFVEATLRGMTRQANGQLFRFWAVVELSEVGGDASQRLDDAGNDQAFPAARYHDDGADSELCVRGWVFRTRGENAPDHRKRERLFFWEPSRQDVSDLDGNAMLKEAAAAHGEPLDAKLVRGWQSVIDAYDAASRVRKQAGNDGVSCHHDVGADAHRVLAHGLLCYGLIKGGSIKSLSPVAIGREPHPRAPLELLPDSLGQATSYAELSPADRVFGWVHADADRSARGGRVALRSSLRVGQVQLTPPADGGGIVEQATDRPLAILSSPKPAYGRFYVANGDGSPAGQGDKRTVGYRDGNRLRGRKVYPHQPMAEHPRWFSSGSSQPWAAKGEIAQSDQSRTIRHWVRPGTRLTFAIDIRNLDEVELGALLVALQPTGSSHLRLGYGKPLGFGSIRIETVEVRVEDGLQRRDRLASFDAGPPAPRDQDTIDGWQEAFLSGLNATYSADGDAILRAVRAEARGFKDGILVSYPLGDQGYTWFVDNERQGERRSLPLLDTKAPYHNDE